MAEPAGWQLLERLAAVLANMTGTRPWGGQYPSDPLVQHHFEAPRSLDAFLRIRIREDSGSSTFIENINLPGAVKHIFTVRIEATITGHADQPPQGWVQRVKDDLLTTVMANLTLKKDGKPLTSGWENPITWATSENEGELGQQVTLTMSVQYRFSETKGVG